MAGVIVKTKDEADRRGAEARQPAYKLMTGDEAREHMADPGRTRRSAPPLAGRHAHRRAGESPRRARPSCAIEAAARAEPVKGEPDDDQEETAAEDDAAKVAELEGGESSDEPQGTPENPAISEHPGAVASNEPQAPKANSSKKPTRRSN